MENLKVFNLYSEIGDISIKKVLNIEKADVVINKEGIVEIVSNKLEEDISNLLIKLDVPMKYKKSHYYMIEAVQLVINNPGMFIRDIYSKVGKTFNNSISNVIVRIGFAVDRILNSDNYELQDEILDLWYDFNIGKNEPSKSELIFFIAEYIKYQRANSEEIYVYSHNKDVSFNVVSDINKADIIIAENGCIKDINSLNDIILNRFEREILELLIKLGITPKINCYYYISETLKILINNFNLIGSLENIVYPMVAKKCNISAKTIERRIVTIVNRIFINGNKGINKEVFKVCFDLKRNMITASEFLFCLVEYITVQRVKVKKVYVYSELKDISIVKVSDEKNADVKIYENGSIKVISNHFEKDISEILNKFGITKRSKFYGYIILAVKIVIKNPDLITSDKKKLYFEISKACNITPVALENGLKYITKTIFKKGNLKFQREFLGVPESVDNFIPTDTEFIYSIVSYFKNQEK